MKRLLVAAVLAASALAALPAASASAIGPAPAPGCQLVRTTDIRTGKTSLSWFCRQAQRPPVAR